MKKTKPVRVTEPEAPIPRIVYLSDRAENLLDVATINRKALRNCIERRDTLFTDVEKRLCKLGSSGRRSAPADRSGKS